MEPEATVQVPSASSLEASLPPHSDNVEEELGRIRLALDAVYGSTAAIIGTANNNDTAQWYQQRQLANRYLTCFQNTAIAWVVCDRLLWENGSQSMSANDAMKQQQRHFFAAQTLHTKCRSDHDVRQLLQQQQQQGGAGGDLLAGPTATSPILLSLRDSLLQHLNRSVTSPTGANPALATRLAMSISALGVQMGWTTVINDILSTVTHPQTTSGPAQHHAQSILFLLRALPEECASDRLMLIDDNNRFILRDHFINTSATVFAFFLHHLSASNNTATTGDNRQTNHQLRVLQAWYAWIRYVPVRPHVIAESPLLPATLQILIASATPLLVTSLDIVEQAADVVVEILRMYPSHGPPDNQILVQQMLTLLSKLPLQQVLASENSNQDDDEDIDIASDRMHVVRDYCRIVTEMGESYLNWIFMAAASSSPSTTTTPQEKEAAFPLVDWVLLCSSSVSDIDIAGITLHFWYRMVMELEQTGPPEWRQELIDLYSTRLLQFVGIAAQNLMKFPKDIAEIAEDHVEDINRHRYYVSETVEDCCRLLGGDAVLSRISELLQQQVMGKYQSNTMNYSTLLQHDWQGLESCLSCLVAIHRFVPKDENQLLPFVFEMLVPGLATAAQQQASTAMPPPLRFSVCKVIGKFAAWLASHAASKPHLMPPLLPFLAQGLYVTECAPAAAVAIKELCVEANHAFEIGQPVLELYEQVSVLSRNPTQPSNQQFVLDLRDELQLLEGVCLALSRDIQAGQRFGGDNGTVYMQRLVQPMGNRIAESVSSPNASPRTVMPDIQRLAVVVQHLKVFLDLNSTANHPIVELMQSLWSFLESLIVRFPNDTNTAEQICRLHKHAMRSCGAAVYSPMLARLMRHLVEAYDRSHQSPFLYAASVCVSEYGGARRSDSHSAATPANTQEELYGMVEAMSTISFSFLKNLQDFNNHPDVVEGKERRDNFLKQMQVPRPVLIRPVVS